MTARLEPFAASIERGLEAIEKLDYAGALAALAPAVRSRPRHPAANYHVARAYYFLGKVDRASKHLRRAVRPRPSLDTLGFRAVIAAFDPAMNHRAVLACRRALFVSLRRALGKRPCADSGPLTPRKILRVGYVSSFFHAHNWMKPVWGLIDHHNRNRVDPHVFSDSRRTDVARRRARLAQAGFHDISRLDNAQAADLVAANRIDILVDLNGFSRTNRLPLFLARPAPLVVAWFNIFGTTGMSCFDAIIGDRWVIRGNEERWYSERVVRLPVSYLAFEVSYPVPRVQPPPCLRNGFITFGSLTSLYKWNDQVLRAWAEILRRSRSSRLILANALLGTESNRNYTVRRFADLGIPARRLTMLGGAPHYEFLKRYDLIDIALDTFPYNGGTTTSEAIWQGVPVLTFVGDRWISRTSASIQCNAGLEEFVCKDTESYVASAARWGSSRNSPSRLAELRSTMRRRLRTSSILDCSRFARLMEKTYETLSESAIQKRSEPRS
jgi:protein O-GlcNAc transferase